MNRASVSRSKKCHRYIHKEHAYITPTGSSSYIIISTTKLDSICSNSVDIIYKLQGVSIMHQNTHTEGDYACNFNTYTATTN